MRLAARRCGVASQSRVAVVVAVVPAVAVAIVTVCCVWSLPFRMIWSMAVIGESRAREASDPLALVHVNGFIAMAEATGNGDSSRINPSCVQGSRVVGINCGNPSRFHPDIQILCFHQFPSCHSLILDINNHGSSLTNQSFHSGYIHVAILEIPGEISTAPLVASP